MELLLYSLKLATLTSTVKLILGKDTFTIDGYDRGSGVKKILGGYGYEYSLTVEKKFAHRLEDDKQKAWFDQELVDFFKKIYERRAMLL